LKLKGGGKNEKGDIKAPLYSTLIWKCNLKLTTNKLNNILLQDFPSATFTNNNFPILISLFPRFIFSILLLVLHRFSFHFLELHFLCWNGYNEELVAYFLVMGDFASILEIKFLMLWKSRDGNIFAMRVGGN
jgi:hypothetical protein